MVLGKAVPEPASPLRAQVASVVAAAVQVLPLRARVALVARAKARVSPWLAQATLEEAALAAARVSPPQWVVRAAHQQVGPAVLLLPAAGVQVRSPVSLVWPAMR
jgi:hypothetical protein